MLCSRQNSRLALFALGLAVLSAISPASRAQTAATAPETPQKLDAFVVTGSLIPIAAGSPAIPVRILSALEIEKSGVSTDLIDVLRKSQPAFYGANNLGSGNPGKFRHELAPAQ